MHTFNQIAVNKKHKRSSALAFYAPRLFSPFFCAMLLISTFSTQANDNTAQKPTENTVSQRTINTQTGKHDGLLERLDALAEFENYEVDKTLIEGLKKPQLSKEAKAKLEKVEMQINSADFKENIDKWQEVVAKSMGVKAWKSSEELNINKVVPFSAKPILFISSSMPLHVLNRYARDMAKIQGVMVLNGGVNGLKKMLPTLKFIADVLKKNPTCKQEPCEKYAVDVTIDPVLFSSYQINRVPAFAVHGKENFTAYCNQTQPLNKGSKVSLGDFSIKYHLNQVQQNTEYQALIDAL